LNQTLNILNFSLLGIYFITFYSYFLDFKRDDVKFFVVKRVLLFLSIILSLAFLILLAVELGHLPVTNKFEIFSLISFSVIFTYFLLELLTDIRGTGFFVLGIGLFFQILSVIFFKMEYQVPDTLRNFPLSSHVVTAILSYTGFSISGAYGIMYIILFKKLKQSRFDIFFRKLPNLEILEKLAFVSALIGFVLLSFSIIVGFIWLPRIFSDFSYFDPKLVSTLIVWLFYGVTFFKKSLGNLYGKKLIYLLLANFMIAVVAVIVSGLFPGSFHTFG